MIIITSKSGTVQAASRAAQSWYGTTPLAGVSVIGLIEARQRLAAIRFVEQLSSHTGVPRTISLHLETRSSRVTEFLVVGDCIGDLLAIQFLPRTAALTQCEEAYVWVTPGAALVDPSLQPLMTAMLAGALRQSNTGGDVSYDHARAYIDLPVGTTLTQCARAQQRAVIGASFEADLGRQRAVAAGEVAAVHFGEHGLTAFAPVEIPHHGTSIPAISIAAPTRQTWRRPA